MKKTTSMILAICLLSLCLIFTACSGKNDPLSGEKALSTFEKAAEKSNELDDIDAKITLEMQVSVEGMTMTMPIEMSIKALGIKGNDPIYSLDTSMKMLGMDTSSHVYYEKGWLYTVADGESFKTPVQFGNGDAEEDTLGMLNEYTSMVGKMDEDMLKNAKLTNNSDKSMTLTGDIDEKAFEDIFKDIMEDNDLFEASAKIKDAHVSMTAKDGYLTRMELNCAVEVEAEGSTGTTSVKMICEYNNPGKKVTVTPPDGYKDFKEVTGGVEE